MIYKNVSYEEEGNNPFYYMAYIDPKWYFDNTIFVHPRCKEILPSVCEDFVDIEYIYFPIGLRKIGDKAFYCCSDLKYIHLQEGLRHIGKQAFAGCNKVRKLELPSTIRFIGEKCFEYNDNLATIKYNGTVKQWEMVRKGKDWIRGDHELDIKCKDGVVHVSCRIRYSRWGSKDELVNKGLVKDEIKEIISLPVEQRIERAKGIFDSFYHYALNNKSFSDEDFDTIFYGIPKLFTNTSGGFKPIHYKRYQTIFDLDVSYKEFKRIMNRKSKLEEKAFDLITCRMPAVRRMNIVVIGAALVCKNKSLTWDTRRLINEIMGPLK